MNSIPVSWLPQIEGVEYMLLLLNPQFISIEGMVIIRAHYNPKTFKKNWLTVLKKHRDEIDRIENTINHVHLGNFTANINLQEAIGKHIANIWKKQLVAQFPDFRFEMPLFKNDDEWELALWTKRS